MSKVFLFVLFLSLFLFFPFQEAQAHFTEIDGSISVTMHVDPNDNPKPGKQANLYFLVVDKAKKFSLNKCNCVVTINEKDKQIFKQKVIDRKNAHATIWGTYQPFVFPKNDLYHIVLSGKPVSQNTFQPFSVSWDFRVDPHNPGIVDDDEDKKQPSDIQTLLSALVVVIVGVVFIGIFIKKQVFVSD